MGKAQIEALPIRHAVNRNAAAHKLALNKLHLPYREALGWDLPWHRGIIRTKKSSRSEDFERSGFIVHRFPLQLPWYANDLIGI